MTTVITAENRPAWHGKDLAENGMCTRRKCAHYNQQIVQLLDVLRYYTLVIFVGNLVVDGPSSSSDLG